MEGYHQLFALTKNPKYVKMRPPKKRAAIRIEQYCKRRKDRKRPKWQEDSSCVFAYRFCRGTCHRRDTAGKERAPKSIRRRSEKRSFVKAVRTIRHENRQGRGKLPPCMPQSECGAGYTGYRIFSDPAPDGSQDTGGAFRSRVQRPGVRHRSTGAGHLCPMWQRTDLVQVKRDRHTGRPRKAHSIKAFPPAAVYHFCGDAPETALLANG